jgi:competence protein ComEC
LAAAVATALRAEVEAQAGRAVLWAPVAFGLGSAGYFGLKGEPSGWVALGAALAGGICAALAWRGEAGAWTRTLLALLAVALLGFADAKLATERARAPILAEGTGVRRVSGRVVDIVETAGGRLRLLLEPAAISEMAPAALPHRLRITQREPADVEPGDGVSVLAILDPPPGPASPGGFDFAREAWFSELGGVGLALGPLEPTRLAPMPAPLRLQTGLNALRWRLAERLARRLGGGEAAGLAAAVTTSHQAWLGTADAQALRDAGLAHMLAIAGLHTAAVTGFVFLAVRWLAAAWPWLALRVSGKRLAAGAGLLACLVYLALSGAHPPARRAAVTAGVAFLAMLCGRRAVSLRSLALAALLVLALQPVSVLEPGFQMSFAATAALVALAEVWPHRRRGERIAAPWFIAWPQQIGGWLGAMASVSLVAGAATSPFALQHFNRISTYGLFANFAADLVASAVLMPALVLLRLGAAVGAPGAWLLPARVVSEGAAGAVLAIGRFFAGLPGAVVTLPSAPEPALAIAFLAIVFAALWRGRLRWAAAPLSAAVLLWPRPPAPAAWIAADGDNAAVVVEGRAVVLKPDVRQFASQAWETHRGLQAPFDPGAEAALAFSCDRLGCLPTSELRPALGAWWGRRPVPPERLAELCRASDIVVVRGPPPAADACPGALMLTRADFDRGGAAEVYPAPDSWRVVWANTERGERPWTHPAAAPQRPSPSPRLPSPRRGESQV